MVMGSANNSSSFARAKQGSGQLLPRRVQVETVVESRYHPGSRPVSWDSRREGEEKILTAGGEVVTLYSSGGQSSPAPGWEILLTKIHPDTSSPAFEWTLFGIASAKS